MKNIKSLVLILFMSFYSELYSQGWGEAKCFSYLKDEKKISLKFNYDQLRVEDIWTSKSIWKRLWKKEKSSELKTENEFLRMRAAEYDKKKAGLGKLWVQDWEQNKKSEFEPNFEKFFNKGTKHSLLGDRFADSLKYTILINVKEMLLGASGENAICDFEVLIFETAKPSDILSKAQMYGVYGLKFNRNQIIVSAIILPIVLICLVSGSSAGALSFTIPSSFSDRVKDCYAECGKDLGKEVRLSFQPPKRFSFYNDPE